MQNKIVEKSKAILSESEQVTRNIWLAGLGVYSKSIEEAKSQKEKSETLFDELVAKGREVESSTRASIEQTNNNLDARVKSLFNRLNIIGTNKGIDEIDAKLDQLTEMVEKLGTKK